MNAEVRLNAGKWAISYGLLAIMAVCVFYIVIAVYTYTPIAESRTALAITEAILFGWLGAIGYKILEFLGVRSLRLQGFEDPYVWVEDFPLLTVFFGLLDGEDLGEDFCDRDGPAYGWLPIAMGLAGVLVTTYLMSWEATVASVAVFAIAACCECPFVRGLLIRQARPDYSRMEELYTLLVPGALAGWALELISKPLHNVL